MIVVTKLVSAGFLTEDFMLRKSISLILIIAFLCSLVTPVPKAQAQGLLGLPEPGTMVALSPAYQPAIIKGLTVHKDNPFLFDFIVDVGQDHLQGPALKNEGQKLIKYFLASLAIPEKDLWVNLSPYEKDRTIPEALGQTEMGRDLLAQDYMLKQITASMIYPEKTLGKEFWDKVYATAQAKFGTTQIPVNTFNKVWIMADKAEVFEHNQTVFVINCHLKVMLEEDYLSLSKHQRQSGEMFKSELQRTCPQAGCQATQPLNVKALQGNHPNASPTPHSISSQILRQIILPQLEVEVNTGKNFANLRQICNSLILASWYKKNLKTALLNQIYTNKERVKGLQRPVIARNGVTKQSQQDLSPEQIFQRYLQAYKKGVFNYIKEYPFPPLDGKACRLCGSQASNLQKYKLGQGGVMLPRKYFSGGFHESPAMVSPQVTNDPAQLVSSLSDRALVSFKTEMGLNGPAMRGADQDAAIIKFKRMLDLTDTAMAVETDEFTINLVPRVRTTLERIFLDTERAMLFLNDLTIDDQGISINNPDQTAEQVITAINSLGLDKEDLERLRRQLLLRFLSRSSLILSSESFLMKHFAAQLPMATLRYGQREGFVLNDVPGGFSVNSRQMLRSLEIVLRAPSLFQQGYREIQVRAVEGQVVLLYDPAKSGLKAEDVNNRIRQFFIFDLFFERLRADIEGLDAKDLGPDQRMALIKRLVTVGWPLETGAVFQFYKRLIHQLSASAEGPTYSLRIKGLNMAVETLTRLVPNIDRPRFLMPHDLIALSTDKIAMQARRILVQIESRGSPAMMTEHSDPAKVDQAQELPGIKVSPDAAMHVSPGQVRIHLNSHRYNESDVEMSIGLLKDVIQIASEDASTEPIYDFNIPVNMASIRPALDAIIKLDFSESILRVGDDYQIRMEHASKIKLRLLEITHALQSGKEAFFSGITPMEFVGTKKYTLDQYYQFVNKILKVREEKLEPAQKGDKILLLDTERSSPDSFFLTEIYNRCLKLIPNDWGLARVRVRNSIRLLINPAFVDNFKMIVATDFNPRMFLSTNVDQWPVVRDTLRVVGLHLAIFNQFFSGDKRLDEVSRDLISLLKNSRFGECQGDLLLADEMIQEATKTANAKGFLGKKILWIDLLKLVERARYFLDRGEKYHVEFKNIHGFPNNLRVTLSKDQAMNSVATLTANGGIDLNTDNTIWTDRKEGSGVEMKFDQAMKRPNDFDIEKLGGIIARIKREGIDSLTPEIYSITPLGSIWPLIGLEHHQY